MSEWSMPGVDEWAVPGYTEERLIGRGASGRVVAAASETSVRRVAIKYLDDALVVRDAEFLRGFRSIAERLTSLDSPHVVRLIDFVEQPGTGAALVMTLVDGVSLREMIARGEPLGPEAALVVLKDSLLGLEAVHSLDLAHGDLKPENVLIDSNGWCTLTDVGVAIQTSRRIPAGTPAYLAPERWSGAAGGPASDIYAATAMLWESVTGKPAFSGSPGQLRRQHQSAAVPIERFGQPLQGLIAWGMAKKPADRPHSARAFADDVETRAVAAYGPDWEERGRRDLGERVAALMWLREGTMGSSAAATRSARRKRRNVVLAACAGAAALVALVALVLAGMSGKAQQASLTSAPVSTAQVIVTPPVVASTCATPTTFTYTGTITTTAAGKLSYQWLYSSGTPGPVQTLSFAGAGHRQVSGGSVTASTAAGGWAEIKLVSGAATTSNRATYQLLCATAKSGLALTASVRPKSQTVYSCAAAPPTLTVTGTIKSKKAESVNYYWALADGQKSAARTVTFKAAGTKTLPPLKVTPPALPASGEAVLVVTKPTAVASRPATYTVSCIAPVTSLPTPGPTGGPAPNGGSTTSGPGGHRTSAPPTRTATSAGPTHPGAPTTPTTTPPTTPPPTTPPPPTTAPPTTPPPTTAPPTTPPGSP